MFVLNVAITVCCITDDKILDDCDKTLSMTKDLRSLMNTTALNTEDDLKYAKANDMKQLEALL